MGIIYKPEDFLKRRRRLPPYLEGGLRNLSPGLRETVRKIIESHYDDFKDLPKEEALKKLREKYKLKI